MITVAGGTRRMLWKNVESSGCGRPSRYRSTESSSIVAGSIARIAADCEAKRIAEVDDHHTRGRTPIGSRANRSTRRCASHTASAKSPRSRANARSPQRARAMPTSVRSPGGAPRHPRLSASQNPVVEPHVARNDPPLVDDSGGGFRQRLRSRPEPEMAETKRAPFPPIDAVGSPMGDGPGHAIQLDRVGRTPVEPEHPREPAHGLGPGTVSGTNESRSSRWPTNTCEPLHEPCVGLHHAVGPADADQNAGGSVVSSTIPCLPKWSRHAGAGTAKPPLDGRSEPERIAARRSRRCASLGFGTRRRRVRTADLKRETGHTTQYEGSEQKDAIRPKRRGNAKIRADPPPSRRLLNQPADEHDDVALWDPA